MNSPLSGLREEILRAGAVSFARFMEQALYAPQTGYYETVRPIGRGGDFYTSVSVGPLFGELLAWQFARWLETHSGHVICEAGAHDGRLARDLLQALRQHNPRQFEKTAYWIIEPSMARKARQKENLELFNDKVTWFSGWNEVLAKSLPGVIFSNELLDAFACHRWVWEAKAQQWAEMGVTWENDRLAWVKLPVSASALAEAPVVPPELAAVLPDGFLTETCPAATRWWKEAAARLQRGVLCTFDYGLTAEEFFHPERAEGTLRGYHQHRLVADLLANVGEQDLTAQVNFSALQAAGEKAGLTTDVFESQGRFLTRLLESAVAQPERFGPWTPARTRQFQTLTHPAHLGRAFSVLVQRV